MILTSSSPLHFSAVCHLVSCQATPRGHLSQRSPGSRSSVSRYFWDLYHRLFLLYLAVSITPFPWRSPLVSVTSLSQLSVFFLDHRCPSLYSENFLSEAPKGSVLFFFCHATRCIFRAWGITYLWTLLEFETRISICPQEKSTWMTL